MSVFQAVIAKPMDMFVESINSLLSILKKVAATKNGNTTMGDAAFILLDKIEQLNSMMREYDGVLTVLFFLFFGALICGSMLALKAIRSLISYQVARVHLCFTLKRSLRI